MTTDGAGHCGFTLIELIVTLLIAVILGTVMVVYFGGIFHAGSTRSVKLQATFELQKAMENITEDYNRRKNAHHLRWKSSTDYTTGHFVTPETPNGHFYECTSAGTGTSGASEPFFPSDGTGEFSDGSLKWTDSLTVIKNNINKNLYGNYIVVENKFIKFVSGVETDISSGDDAVVLKVVIGNDFGETLTAMFTASN